MANTIRHKRGTTVPVAGDLVTGEIAIKTDTGTLYTKTDGGTVVSVGGGGTWGSITGTLSSQTDLDTALGLKAPLASPALTGTPTAPTASVSDNSTQIATTAYVKSQGQVANFYTQGRNTTGSTIPAFSVLYINGATSGVPNWGLARADSGTTSDTTFGVTTNSIANNANGNVITAGILSNVNTSAYTVGTQLWLSASVAGAVTSTQPTAPNHTVYIGIVTVSSAGSGQVSLAIQNGYHLASSHDVSTSSLTNLDLLAYESSTSLWKNKSASTIGLAPLASPTFTGNPSLPTGTSGVTQTAGDNTTKLATTAFVTTANNLKANLASPALTGTPTAPTASTSTNTTQIATTAYVKTNLTSYATLAGNPAFTGYPTAGTAATSNETTTLATTAFVKANIRKIPTTFNGDIGSTGSLDENACYLSNTNASHIINLFYAGYYNALGTVLMFYQNDNQQIEFSTAGTSAPNGNRYYAAFPGATIFAVKTALPYYWAIYGDLISTQYTPYGTVFSGPTLDTSNTVSSGYMDYNNDTVQAYTNYNTVANGWGGSFNQNTNASYGTTMSASFQYSQYDYYHLSADGGGGYFLTFEYSSGGGPDAYGTKYGTPYWDGSAMSLYQAIADGTGGTTYIPWDGASPYPSYGTQTSSTSFGNYGPKTDAIGNTYNLYYDSTNYADGYGGVYDVWGMSSGYNYPSLWAFDAYHVDTSLQNTTTYWYDSSYNQIYPYDYGYNGADGSGNTIWISTTSGTSWYPSIGTQMTPDYYDTSSTYGRMCADGYGGYYWSPY
jgi:hypothetical protein